jgi:hypothetical protein
LDHLANFLASFLSQLQSPTLAFLIGGMVLAATGSKLTIADSVYRFIIFVLLMSIGLGGGMEIRDANLAELALPALFAAIIGCVCVLLGAQTLGRLPGVERDDAYATAGLFGAVSASTLAVVLVVLEERDIPFEAWAPALYPFMDIPALVLAIVLAGLHRSKNKASERPTVRAIIVDSLRGSALSALLLGLAIGLIADPVRVYDGFYDLLFRGFLSVLMLVLGMEAWSRLSELRKVAQWYVVYAVVAPITHGLLGFGLGYIAHVLTGFSPGGVIILAVIAASNSDISGPPTLRAGIPGANPSSYIGASTSVGTPIAIAVCVPLFVALGELVFGL